MMRLSYSALSASFFFFGMWSIYLYKFGIRPFDIIGFFILMLAFFNNFINHNLRVNQQDLHLFGMLFLWFICYLIIGSVNFEDSTKISIGLFLGLAVFSMTYLLNPKIEKLIGVIDLYLKINILFIFFQFFYYYSFGDFLNPFEKVGLDLEPRALGQIFRPTGLFLEPATYSLTMIMVLSLRQKVILRFDFLAALTLVSILLTFSFWGIVATGFYLVIKINNSSKIKLLTLALVSSILISLVLPDFHNIDIFNWLTLRLENISHDNSLVDRYKFLFLDSGSLSVLHLLFGHGFNSDFSELGSSGIAFIISSCGFIGTTFFFYLLAALNKNEINISKLLIFILFLSAAPIWNTFILWFWMALFFRMPDVDELRI